MKINNIQFARLLIFCHFLLLKSKQQPEIFLFFHKMKTFSWNSTHYNQEPFIKFVAPRKSPNRFFIYIYILISTYLSLYIDKPEQALDFFSSCELQFFWDASILNLIINFFLCIWDHLDPNQVSWIFFESPGYTCDHRLLFLFNLEF